METVTKRRRGRKSVYSEKASTKNITLYQEHYDTIANEGMETSTFARWLIENKKIEYISLGQPDCSRKTENTIPTSASLYKNDIENLVDIDNFSNFLRWGFESSDVIKEYKAQ